MTQPKELGKPTPIVYDLLTQDEMDEMLVEYMRAQQRDHFLHSINLQRAREVVAMLPAESPFRAHMEQFAADTESRIQEVESLIRATEAQMPPQERRVAALEKIQQREAAQRLQPSQ